MSDLKQKDPGWRTLPIISNVFRFIELFSLEVIPLYMLTTTEKIVVGTLTVGLIVLLLIAVVVYLPAHLAIMIERLYYYATGSPLPGPDLLSSI